MPALPATFAIYALQPTSTLVPAYAVTGFMTFLLSCSLPAAVLCLGGRVGGTCCLASLLPEALHAVTWKGMGCTLSLLQAFYVDKWKLPEKVIDVKTNL